MSVFVRRAPAIVLVALLALVAMACGGDDDSTVAATTTISASTNISGSLTVFAAASLTEAFTDEKDALASSAPDLDLTLNFAGSSTLVTQIQQGAPADVIATADEANMQKLVDAGLVGAPQVFAHNKLEILVAPGNPKHITALADLAASGLIVVLCDPSVPAGKYAAQALSTAGVTVSPASLELDVKSAVAKVTSGEADATIVYVTDVIAAGTAGTGVPIPDEQNVIATYPIAVLSASSNQEAAAAFVDLVVHGAGQSALAARGFLPPT